MNAEEARRLNLEYIEQKVKSKYNPDGIDSAIKEAASKGKTFVNINIEMFEEQIKIVFLSSVVTEYEKKRGFKVIREKGYDDDPRGSSSWDYIRISW